MTGRQTGFTYLVMLLAVAIFGAGLAAVGPVWHALLQRDREIELLYVGNQFRMAINRYYAANHHYPLHLEDLVLDERSQGIRRHLRKIFVDPMTGRAEWGTVKSAEGRVVGVYSLSEARPLKRAGFRTNEAAFAGKDKYSDWVFMAATARAVDRRASAGTATPKNTPFNPPFGTWK